MLVQHEWSQPSAAGLTEHELTTQKAEKHPSKIVKDFAEQASESQVLQS